MGGKVAEFAWSQAVDLGTDAAGDGFLNQEEEDDFATSFDIEGPYKAEFEDYYGPAGE